MKIVSLVDDVCNNEELSSEHGLSLYIETSNHKILFDLGASRLFAENASKLNIDLQKVDTVIISHGHYDHGSGLKIFLNINNHAKIYINKNAFGDYYSQRNGEYEYAGLDKDLQKEKRLIFTDDYLSIDKELTLFGAKAKNMPSLNKTLMKKTQQGFVEDSFEHEQSLIISGDKTVLITGCSHCGIINIVDKATKIIAKAPDYVIGGFHLYNSKQKSSENQENIKDIARALSGSSSNFYTCHCTGIPPYKKLKQTLNNLHYLSTGEEIIIK